MARKVRVNTLTKRLKDRYGYAMTVLRGLVKTDFKMRYQGSFLGVSLVCVEAVAVIRGHVYRVREIPETDRSHFDISGCVVARRMLMAVRVGDDWHRSAFDCRSGRFVAKSAFPELYSCGVRLHRLTDLIGHQLCRGAGFRPVPAC